MSAASRDFLVEIGTEELPPKSLPELSRAFADGVAAGLADAGLRPVLRSDHHGERYSLVRLGIKRRVGDSTFGYDRPDRWEQLGD